jgi:formylglycine-generating enzyme required for sulfatase activity
VDGSSGSVNVKDSVMRRSEIDSSAASVNIQDSVVQHTTIKVDSGKKEEDEQLRKERDERERCKQEEQELRRKEEEKRKALEATRLKNTNEAEKNRYSIRKLLAELDAELRQTVTQISDINKPEGNLSKEEQKRLEKLEDKIRILEKRKKRLEGMEVTSESVNQLGNIIFNSNQKKPTRSEDILKAVLQIEKGLNWTQDGLKESIGESSKDKKKTIRNRKKNTDSKPKPYNKVLFLSMLVIAVFVVFSLIENSSDNQNIVVPEYESVDSSAAVSLQDADSDTVQKIEVLQLPWRSDVDIGGDFSLYLLQTDLESNKVYLQCFNDGVIFADKVLGLEGSDSAFWQLIANDVKMVTLIKINENSSCEVEITREIEVSAEDTSNDVSSTKGSLDTYANSIGMEFVKIPSGSFDMGSQSDEEGRNDNEGPIHEVTIEKAYYLGKYEVTQEQWVEVMDSNPSYIKGANNPVENVSWNEVQEFIKSLNEMEGTDKYRLPSEAEWEYACRAGTSTSYSFGDSEPELNDYAWYGDNSGNKAHAVGQKEPNPWGLYDMHGNALEWCQDRCHVSYQEAPTDGSAWEDGSDTSRVWRGGGWGFGAIFCRSASRGYGSPDSAYVDFGFRILKEV